MSDTQINIQSEETAIEFIQEQVAIDFVQEQVAIEFVQETTQIDFVSESIVLNLTGVPGPVGPPGADGADGVGVPAGGSTGQVLAKIDGDDYNTEWVDQDGGGSPGGASITDITYADMQTAITGGTLTEGAFYRITDAAGTDLGFVCQAIKTNEITVNGTGGYLNADFQAVGDYSGVEAVTGVAPGTQLGIWRTGFEVIAIPYTSLQFPADYVSYSTSSGPLDPAETFTTDLGTTGEVITDDGAGTVTVQSLSQALTAGEVITGDTSTNTVTVDSYTVTVKVFAVGDTITGGTTGATAVIVTDDGASSMTAYMTSPGVAFDGSEALDNGDGVTADQDGAAGTPTIVQGDVVIWNLLHWQLTDATLLDGTDPETNTAAYTQLLKTDAGQGYVTAWDVSEFDFANQWLQYRADNRSNKIQYTKREDDANLVLGYTAILDFQWGRDSVYANNSDDGYVGIKNILGNFYRNRSLKSSAFQGCILKQDSSVYGCTFSLAAGALTCTFEEQSGMSNCTFEPAAAMENITFGFGCGMERCIFYHASYFSECTFGGGTSISSNILENGAQLTGITAGANCEISRNKIWQGATLGGGTTMGDGAALNDLDVRANKQISNKTLDAGVTFSDKIVQLTTDTAETYSANVDGNRIQPGFSDIPGTIDIDGLTTLDITAAWAQYRGIINITSPNATESIDTIANPPTLFPFTIRPAAGLVLTITGTAYAGISAGQIALKATDYVLDGDKGEYIVLEIDPRGTGCLIEKYVGNGLI